MNRQGNSDASLALDTFLADYHQIPNPHDSRLIETKNLHVWVNKAGGWIQLGPAFISNLGCRDMSLCRELAIALGVSDVQYREMIRSMKLYQHVENPDTFALVLRLPVNRLPRRLMVGGAGAAGLLLLGGASQSLWKSRNADRHKGDEPPKALDPSKLSTESIDANGHKWYETAKALDPSKLTRKSIDQWIAVIRKYVDYSQQLDQLILFQNMDKPDRDITHGDLSIVQAELQELTDTENFIKNFKEKRILI